MKKAKPTQIALFDFDAFAPEEPIVEQKVENVAAETVAPIQEPVVATIAEPEMVIEEPAHVEETTPVEEATSILAENIIEEAAPIIAEVALPIVAEPAPIKYEAPVPPHVRKPLVPPAPEKLIAPPVVAVNPIVAAPVNQALRPPVNVLRPKSTRGRKSLKEMTASVELVQVPSDEILFQKSYYSIGKVAEMFQVNQSLIRLWEREFDVLKPRKNGKGDRFFRPEDIKNIQLIHHLTREKKYTMEGAKEYFKNNKRADEKFAMIESLKKIKSFLNELRANA